MKLPDRINILNIIKKLKDKYNIKNNNHLNCVLFSYLDDVFININKDMTIPELGLFLLKFEKIEEDVISLLIEKEKIDLNKFLNFNIIDFEKRGIKLKDRILFIYIINELKEILK
jgi:hypothetical protein